MLMYSQWLQLPISTRHAIAQALKINKKNPTHVIDNTVKDDGYPIGDVERALTVENMEEYVGGKGTMEQLWEATVAKAEGRTVFSNETKVPEATVISETKVETSPEIPVNVEDKPKRGRKAIK